MQRENHERQPLPAEHVVKHPKQDFQFLLNNVVAGLTAWFFYWTVTKRFKGMLYPMAKPDQKEFQAKLVGITVSFLFVLLLSYIVPFEYPFIGILPLAFINLRDKFS